MDDHQLLQFSRHIMLPDFDVEGQEKLLQASILLIGAGGLGSPIALYLGAAGVGTLTIVDDDQVDTSNLQRQIAHRTADVGVNKAESAMLLQVHSFGSPHPPNPVLGRPSAQT